MTQPIALRKGRVVYASDEGEGGRDRIYSVVLDGSDRTPLVGEGSVPAAGSDAAEFQHRLKENICGGSADGGPEFGASPTKGLEIHTVGFQANSQRYPKADIHFGDGAVEPIDTGSGTSHDYEAGTYETHCVFNIPACAPNGTKKVQGPVIEVVPFEVSRSCAVVDSGDTCALVKCTWELTNGGDSVVEGTVEADSDSAQHGPVEKSVEVQPDETGTVGVQLEVCNSARQAAVVLTDTFGDEESTTFEVSW